MRVEHNWLLVDLNLSGKNAIVIAQCDVAKMRAKQLLSEGAKVTIFTIGKPSKDLVLASISGEVAVRNRISPNIRELKSALDEIHPFLTVISTGSSRTDQKIAEYARRVSRLVYVVDRPKLNDLNMTGVAKVGDIRIAVSTHGLSPAMSGLLRRKIESVISREDVLQVKLLGEVRRRIKRSINDPLQRKRLVYSLIRNKKILSLLKSDRFDDAKRYALSVIASNERLFNAVGKKKGIL